MRRIDKIDVCDDVSIPVEYVDDMSELGHWSESENVIRINESISEEEKIIVLMHEMIHMAETQMIASGILSKFYDWVIRPIWGEIIVENLASFLFQWMSRSNMLNPYMITREEAVTFIDKYLEEYPESGVKS